MIMEKDQVDVVEVIAEQGLDGASLPEWTVEEERELRMKVDIRVMPLMFLLFTLCFLDRTNIGNAYIQGMGDDLDLTGDRFNTALSIFYVTYIVVEVPSNLILKVVGGKTYIPLLVMGFGLVSMCTAFLRNYSGLLAIRFFLGVTEGGVLPGIAYYLSTFYRRKELQLRISIFIMGASMAGAFGGLLAAGLSKIPSWGLSSLPIHTWRNIFFFEGILSIVVAIVASVVLPKDPASAKFLSERSRMIAMQRLTREYKESAMEKVGILDVTRAFTSIHGSLCAVIFFFLNIAIQSFSVFLPTILRDLGYTATQAQLRSVAPYCAACTCAILFAWLSTRVGVRGPFIAVACLVSTAGYAVLCASNSDAAKYAAVFVAAIGTFFAGPATISWGLSNAAGAGVRSVTSAYIVAVGNCGALIATWTYLPSMAPEFKLGHALNMTATGCACLVSLAAFVFCRWENGKRARGERDSRLEGRSEEETNKLGSLHPEFQLLC